MAGVSAASSISYGLCACTSAGVMLTVILLLWHCVRFRGSTPSKRLIKYAFATLLATYALLGVSVTLLVLHNDVTASGLCKAGGFFALFSTQMALWSQAALAVLLLAHKRGRWPCSLRHWCWRKDESVGGGRPSWGVAVLIGALTVVAIIVCVLSFLPLTELSYFGALPELYYTCVPLRLPGEPGWGHSTLVLMLDWSALLLAIVCTTLTAVISLRRRSRAQTTPAAKSRASCVNVTAEYETLRLLLTLVVSETCWSVMLLLFSISYFSGGEATERYTTQWILAFLLSIVVLLQPMSALLAGVVTGTRCFERWAASLSRTPLRRNRPSSLHNVIKAESAQQVSA